MLLFALISHRLCRLRIEWCVLTMNFSSRRVARGWRLAVPASSGSCHVLVGRLLRAGGSFISCRCWWVPDSDSCRRWGCFDCYPVLLTQGLWDSVAQGWREVQGLVFNRCLAMWVSFIFWLFKQRHLVEIMMSSFTFLLTLAAEVLILTGAFAGYQTGYDILLFYGIFDGKDSITK